MSRYARIAKRVWQGLPYARKEAGRMLSMQTGLLLSTPTFYYIVFGWRCDGKCRFCWVPGQRDTEKLDQLPGDVMLRVLREAKELSGRGFNISLSGGEPLIYKPIYDVLKLAQELQINVGITTNGYLLTGENVRRILSFDPFNINVSLESVDPAVNERLRALPGGTLKTLKGIENILEEKRRTGARVSVFVKPTITEVNYRSLPELVRFFGKEKAIAINPQPLLWDPLEEQFWVQNPDELGKVMEELAALRGEGYGIVTDPNTLRGFVDYFRRGPKQHQTRAGDPEHLPKRCSVGFRNILICPDGKVFLCQLVNKEIGNLNDGATLKEMWHGKVAAAQRRGMLKCQINCQLSCTRPTPLLTKIKAFLRSG